MKHDFKNILTFIQKYYEKFLLKDIDIYVNSNLIEVRIKGITFGINILNNFVLDSRLESINDIFLKETTIKLIDYLNKNFYIPLDIRINGISFQSSMKSIFLISIVNTEEVISEQLITIVNNSEVIYTNKIDDFINTKYFSYNKKLFDLKDIYTNDDYYDITIVLYGDMFCLDFNIVDLYNKYDKSSIYILPSSSNFINNYSLSVSNYGALYFHGLLDFDDNIDIISNIKLLISNHNLFDKSTLSDFTYSLEVKNYSILNILINKIKNSDINEYGINIIFNTKSGYYNIFNSIKDINISLLEFEENIINISIFIFTNSFLLDGFSNFNSFVSPKTFTFLSSPLGKTKEFNFKTIDSLVKSKYIFGESLDGTRNIFSSLNITYDDKEIYYGDDLTLFSQDKYEKLGINCIDKIPEVFPELYNLLVMGKKIFFLTDGGVPCILDPGDYIKKYIIKNFPDYSIIGLLGPSVLASVLLGSRLKFKKIYWSSLLYSVALEENNIKKNNIYSKNIFFDTLIIFYSFGNNIKNDLEIFNNIFDDSISLQLIGDISTEREYNKLFNDIKDITYHEKEYIFRSISNLVYLIMYK